MLSKYITIHILLSNMHLDCRGEGSSNRNASRDESVETGDESVETRDESIEAGEKHSNHVIDISNYSPNAGVVNTPVKLSHGEGITSIILSLIQSSIMPQTHAAFANLHKQQKRLYQHTLTLTPSCISNYMHYKV